MKVGYSRVAVALWTSLFIGFTNSSSVSAQQVDPCKLASQLLGSNKFKSALHQYNVCLQLHPNLKTALYGRGKAHWKMGNPKQAYEDFTRVIEIDQDYKAYWLRACTLVEMDRFADAIADCTKSIKVEPSKNAFNLRGRLLSQTGKIKEGICDLSEAIRISPVPERGLYADRGNAYSDLKQYDKAIADYTSAIHLGSIAKTEVDDTILMRCYANRAIAYEKMGKPDLAKRDRQTLEHHAATESSNMLLELAK